MVVRKEIIGTYEIAIGYLSNSDFFVFRFWGGVVVCAVGVAVFGFCIAVRAEGIAVTKGCNITLRFDILNLILSIKNAMWLGFHS